MPAFVKLMLALMFVPPPMLLRMPRLVARLIAMLMPGGVDDGVTVMDTVELVMRGVRMQE